MPHRDIDKVRSLQSFPSENASIADGEYAVKFEHERELSSSDATVQAELWLKSPVRVQKTGLVS